MQYVAHVIKPDGTATKIKIIASSETHVRENLSKKWFRVGNVTEFHENNAKPIIKEQLPAQADNTTKYVQPNQPWLPTDLHADVHMPPISEIIRKVPGALCGVAIMVGIIFLAEFMWREWENFIVTDNKAAPSQRPVAEVPQTMKDDMAERDGLDPIFQGKWIGIAASTDHGATWISKAEKELARAGKFVFEPVDAAPLKMTKILAMKNRFGRTCNAIYYLDCNDLSIIESTEKPDEFLLHAYDSKDEIFQAIVRISH